MFIMYIKMMSENPDRSGDCLRFRQNEVEAFLRVCYIYLAVKNDTMQI